MLSRVAATSVHSVGKRCFSTGTGLKEVVIVSTARTPVGTFGGALANIPGPKLQAETVKAVLQRAGVKPEQVTEAIFGNVVSANVGQAPARQAAILAGLPHSTVCTTINKVCASGMKAVMYGAQSIMLGHHEIVVAGGFENMSLIPYYLDKARTGYRMGNGTLIDGLSRDGLSDAFTNEAMGMSAEDCATRHGVSRKEQDEYSIQAYKRTAEATKQGLFKAEMIEISVQQAKGDPVMMKEDEEYKKTNYDKIPTLKTIFKKDGSVTAANSSKVNDGACSLLLMSRDKANQLGLKPLALIRGFGDAEQEPIQFPTTPSLAIPIALKNAGLKKEEIDYWEINEAFAVVALANQKLLDLNLERLNVWGGGVSIGHPIGCSGARITASLAHILDHYKAKYGVASICNGGGGASAIVIERL